MRIEILQGPSCSGKSTYAQDLVDRNIAVVVSRDLLREKLIGKRNIQRYFEQGMDYCLEEYVSKEQLKLLAKYIIKCKDRIVIDNTNLKKKYIQEFVNVFGDLGVSTYRVSITKFDEDISTLNERAKNRLGKVTPIDVLIKQSEQFHSINWGIEDFIENDSWKMNREKREWHFCQFEVEKYFPNVSLPDAVICDLDGTLCHRRLCMYRDFIGYRSYYDYSKCENDEIDLSVADVIDAMARDGKRILFVSGRKESARKNTEKFIRGCFGKNFNYRLFMRAEEDNRNDAITKYEIFNDFIRDNYYVDFVIDDRKRVCTMWEELGLKVFNVGSLNDNF